jgi:hypothetical protein
VNFSKGCAKTTRPKLIDGRSPIQQSAARATAGFPPILAQVLRRVVFPAAGSACRLSGIPGGKTNEK